LSPEYSQPTVPDGYKTNMTKIINIKAVLTELNCFSDCKQRIQISISLHDQTLLSCVVGVCYFGKYIVTP